MSFLMSYVCSVDNKNSADNENLQQKSPCPPCIPWITKISGSPTYKKKRRYSHTTSSAQKNPYLIYFCSCKYTNITDTLQIFPQFFVIHGFYLKILLKIFVKMSSRRRSIIKSSHKSEELERIFSQDCYLKILFPSNIRLNSDDKKILLAKQPKNSSV